MNAHLNSPADLGATVDRLKAIATQATDALLTEGPVHPDHELLDICAESLHHRRLSAELRESRDALPAPYGNPAATPEQNLLRRKFEVEGDAARDRAVQMSKRAAKLKARTPAGIYAKALVVRSSQTGAAVLAMSLAEDLVGCEVLRHSLWPAATAEASA